MTGHPGFNVMLHRLSSNAETVDAHNGAVGKTIADIRLDKEQNRLYLDFEDGTGIYFFDDGQSCCEDRWMNTDDDLQPFIGATFTGAELREGPGFVKDRQDHEEEFLLINTSLGTFTVVNYNEHNGYYGGFAIVVRAT